MTTKPVQVILALGAASVLLAGCGRKDTETSSPQRELPKAPASSTTAGEPAKALDAAKAQVSTATATATAAVQVVRGEVDAAAAKAQGLIDQAKTLVSEKKWAEALKLLSSLSQQNLTAEQQGVVQKLQEQAQQGAASSVKTGAETEAANAVNKLLTPKR